jgi:predicted O-linked N-acetylglucosamine transferase (SPINDLY family)
MPDPTRLLQAANDLIAQGRLAEAAAPVEQALRLSPDDHAAHCLMCYLLTKRGEYEGAIRHIERAIRAVPGDSNYLANLGKLQWLTGRLDDAVATLRRALRIWPSNLNAHVDLANALMDRREFAAAAEVCRAGLAHHVEHPLLSHNLGLALLNLGEVEAAVARFRRGAAANPLDLTVAAGLAGAMNYLPGATAADVAAAHLAYGRLLERVLPERLPEAPVSRDPDRPLRLGLVSPDLRAHPVACFIEPLLEGLDRSRFHTTCYMTSARADATTDRLRRLAGAWRDAAAMNEVELAKQVRADRIDILVDLAGLTRGQRLATFRLRPAPVQAAYCGYPAPTGIAEIDLRIVDSLTDPPGSEVAGTEALLRIDPCFLCYAPPADAPEPDPVPPSRRSSTPAPVTFGSFNAMQKINTSVVHAWSALLARVPGSRLLVKNPSLDGPEAAAALRRRFAARGIGPERLEFAGWSPTVAEHLAAHARVDIALDTFPYAGTTTTCESLLMGVPVVTLSGRTHAGRVGASLLRAAGGERLASLVAATESQYVDIAAALAADAERLASLRAWLRPALLRSPLCDRRAFGERFGAALREAWGRFCRGALPRRDRPPPALPDHRPPTPTTSPATAAALESAMDHLRAGRPARAREVLEAAARRYPTDPAVADLLASVLLQEGEAARAEFAARQGLRGAPADAGLLFTLSQAQALQKQGERAIETLRRAIAAAPAWAEPRAALARLLMAAARHAEAAAICRPLVNPGAVQPAAAAAYAPAAHFLGRVEEAVAALRAAREHSPDDFALKELLAFTLNYDPAATADEVFEAHVAYGAALERAMAPQRLPPAPTPSPDAAPSPGAAPRRLRVGLMSPDLRAHAVASFVEPLARHLDRGAFELTLYYTNTSEDRVSHRLRALADRWRHDAQPDQAALARRIRDDGIDVLVELSGLTALHRLPVMALRPAPVQATWLGYPNTTGLPSIQWRIVDAVTDPAPEADAFAVERLIRLEGCYLCYAAPEEAPEPAPAPPVDADPEQWITFGSLGTLLKFNDRLLGAWAALLGAVPRSRLLLKNHGLTAAENREALAARFAARGIGPERLVLLPPTPGLREHLETYHRVDVALDTFPYAGTTTTCESLLMGVPVVTLAGPPPAPGRTGNGHAARVGLSLLTAAGLPDLAATSVDAYVALGAALAADRARLRDYRRTLRQRLLASPLCDGPAFARRFEAALRTMWAAAADRGTGTTDHPPP